MAGTSGAKPRYFKSPFKWQPKSKVESVWHAVFEDEPDLLGDAPRSDDDVVFVDPYNGEEMSFGRLRDLTKELGHGLLNGGFKKGQTVLVFAYNSLYYPAVVLGLQAAGLVSTFANPAYLASDLAFQIKDSEACAIIVDKAGLKTAETACKEIGLDSRKIFMLERTSPTKHSSIWSLVKPGRMLEPERLPQSAADDIAMLCYSSGTSGRPKGCIISHSNIWHCLHQFPASWPHSVGETTVGVLPLFHMYGLYWLNLKGPKWHARSVVLSAFEPQVFLSAIQKYRPTVCHLVPPIVVFMMQSDLPKQFDLSSIQHVLCGAAPLGEELQTAFGRRFDCKVLAGYGMTETTCVVCVARPENGIIGYNGQLCAGIEGRIVDGELQVRGPNITQGYWKRPDESAELFATDSDGRKWMRTGDVIELGKDEHIAITDRVKELIKYKGFQVAPAQLEDALLAHPAVADAAVIAHLRQHEGTEVPRAFVMLDPSRKASEETAKDILQAVNGKLASFKRIRGGIVFVDAVPKSPSGKILRRLLKDRKGDKIYAEESSTRAKL